MATKKQTATENTLIKILRSKAQQYLKYPNITSVYKIVRDPKAEAIKNEPFLNGGTLKIGTRLRGVIFTAIMCVILHTLAFAETSSKNQCAAGNEDLDCSSRLSTIGVQLDYKWDGVPVFNELFRDACIRHDYCYRHGAKTYGHTQEQCDRELYVNMVNKCAEGIAGKVIALTTIGASVGSCVYVAKAYYVGVRAVGKEHFKSATQTTTCHYKDYCPHGNFATTGIYHNCKCMPGTKKRYTGVGNSYAQCEGPGARTCPPGKFNTEDGWRGCNCPEGYPKKYDLPTKAHAWCEGLAKCPTDKVFKTTLNYRGCKCPNGRKKVYLGASAGAVANSKAVCQMTCPASKFSTTGKYHDCKCAGGRKKHYIGLTKASATCEKTCPSGEFSTTGKYRGCKCAGGRKKHYIGLTKASATCEKTCPSGEFSTTGKYRGCKCPNGKKKDYGIFKAKAKCK